MLTTMPALRSDCASVPARAGKSGMRFYPGYEPGMH